MRQRTEMELKLMEKFGRNWDWGEGVPEEEVYI
jgi:hypothetical protein